MKSHYQILIIGGGTGGIMTAAQLKNSKPSLEIAVIEPSKDHWYQPAWTLVGAGTFDYQETRRDESTLIPKGVDWIQDRVSDILANNNKVQTEHSGQISYDYLVVSPGLQMDPDKLPGLQQALLTDSVCSNYIDPNKTWDVLQNFKGGNAVFTLPSTPIKCGGAPQKIMYLADEYFRKTKVRSKSNIIFATPGTVIFGTREFAETLTQVIKRKDIFTRFLYSPVEIDSANKLIRFKYSGPEEWKGILAINEQLEADNLVTMPYDMLHLAPPQSAPDFIKKSVLAVADGPNKGWLDVNIYSLQHNRFPNVYGLGDVTALPTAKTGAAIRKQAPVVVSQILSVIGEKSEKKLYNGYSSCPLVTGYGKMLLAEFKYGNERDSDPFLSKIMDTTKEQWSMWLLKKYGLPFLYWNRMMKGKM